MHFRDMKIAKLPETKAYKSTFPLKSRLSFVFGAKKCHKANKTKFLQENVKTGLFKDVAQMGDYKQAMVHLQSQWQ
jgi:hypothetical protein